MVRQRRTGVVRARRVPPTEPERTMEKGVTGEWWEVGPVTRRGRVFETTSHLRVSAYGCD